MRGFFKISCAFLLVFITHSCTLAAEKKVVLQLSWEHQFQFAGYYAAKAKGYYGAVGLSVEIRAGGNGRFATQEVTSGRAQYGVGGSELLLYRAEGNQIVVLAAIFQHSSPILLTRADDQLTTPQHLIGKRVMLLPGKKNVDISNCLTH